ncbi:MAG: SDR family oxidoreductase, partial [Alkalispirochaeta sp.]
MTVWVTGGNGMLGGEVTHALKRAGITVVATDMEIDITDIASLHRFVTTTGPFEWIVNCAAWTAVDAAEDNEEAARILNADGPANLAQVAAETGGCLMHISTDYVFDGMRYKPYSEFDIVSPAGVYGKT